MQASAGEAIIQLARRGLGVGILSESMAGADLAGPVAVVIDDIRTPAVLAVIWARTTSPALRELIARCRAAFGMALLRTDIDTTEPHLKIRKLS